MMHSILPPHLARHLAISSPVFRQSLVIDVGIRVKREIAAVAETESGEVTVYDAKNQMGLPGEKIVGEGPKEAIAVRGHAKHIQELMGEGKALPETEIPTLVVNYGDIFPNAFYDGKYLVFGEGDGQIFGDFSVPLEVGAHEFGHKIIDAGPKFEYAGQPGALNEHVADVIGICVKKHAETEGGTKQVESDWRIGGGLFLEKGPALRDMAKPGTAYDNDLLGADPQVGHMDKFVDTFLDNGGVHINSGIPNRAFTVFAEAAGGNVWEKPLNLWIQAMLKGDEKTDFKAFAGFTFDVAAQEDETIRKAVTEGWKAVGITAEQ